MKKAIGLVGAFLTVCLLSPVFADCGSCGDDAAKVAGTATCTGDCQGADCGCPFAKAMAALPKMTYSVGDKSACCEHAAKAMAEAAGTHMHFVVDETEYDSKDKAMVALADVTEKFVNDFATPHTCSVSGTTTVCGASTKCGESAAKMAEVAKEAMNKVAMNFKVGEETCSCSVMAAELAKKSGEKTEYVVGDETTCCAIDARIKLAQAKYRAAIEAIAKLQQESETAASTSQS